MLGSTVQKLFGHAKGLDIRDNNCDWRTETAALFNMLYHSLKLSKLLSE